MNCFIPICWKITCHLPYIGWEQALSPPQEIMKNLGLMLVLAGSLSAAAGCGSGGDVSRVDDFIEKMATAQCAWEFRCCTDPEITRLDGRKFADATGCVPYRTLALQTTLFLHRLAASEGRLSVDSAQADACITQLQARQCNPKAGTATMTDPMAMDACADVFDGKTSIGDACIYSTECEKGAHCVNDATTVGRGVCVPYQNAGEICNTDADCDPKVAGLYCAQADFKCRVRARLGEACLYSTDASGQNAALPLLIECDKTYNNLYCDPMSSKCKQIPGDGEACLSPLPPGVSAQCNPAASLNLVCDHGLSSGGAGTCRAPGKLGESCENIACDKTLYCDTSGLTSTCKNLPSLKQPCSVSGYQCLEPYYCNTLVSPYVCDQPAAVGESCKSPSRTCEITAYCDNASGTCKARLPDGALCVSSSECLSSSCGPTASGAASYECLPSSAVQCVGR